jgi:surface carbohydrate biosynthesis protein
MKKTIQTPLLIPVENQVRELDPKLLLACIAAERGMASIIGPRREMHLHLADFPRSIYLSKSLTKASVAVFNILSKLGHRIIAWDEEALVHPPSEVYYERRLSAEALAYVSHLFAWGADNEALWRNYRGLPRSASISVTGNPRGDLLRPVIRGYYQDQADELRRTFGDFILVNTNFNHVNGFVSALNLFQAADDLEGKSKLGRSGKGMNREYARGLRDHKQSVFVDFQKMIPELDREFPGYSVVIRPHPTENPKIYHDIANRCQRVRVTNEGNIVPWLMAAKGLIHNGCTTGVEAYGVGCPAVTFLATVNEVYDDGFYRLPNRLSHSCFNFEQLKTTLQKILKGELGVAGGESRRALFDQFVAAQDGPLACERMLDVLQEHMCDPEQWPEPALIPRIEGLGLLTGRRLIKTIKSRLPSYAHNSREFQRHRYPSLSRENVEKRISRLQHILGIKRPVNVQQVRYEFFQISPLK